MVSHSRETNGQEWSIWAPLGSAVFVLVSAVVAVIERLAAGQHALPMLLFAGLALVPFALDLLAYATTRPVALPLWAFPIPVLVGTGALVFKPPVSDFAPMILVWTVAEIASRWDRSPVLPIVVALASAGVMASAEVFGSYNGWFVWTIGIAFGLFGGFMMGTLLRQQGDLKQAQATLAEKAAADERSHIAREVHDVIAHSLSVTMLHVTAARLALERGAEHSSEALDALLEAEHQGRSSMSEIRRTVGLLGPDANGQAQPLPGLTDLPKLVSDFVAAGLDVTFAMNGDVKTLPPGAGLSVYRIVQESLTNVVKHAPGASARVELDLTDDELRLRVHNRASVDRTTMRSDDAGLGVRGMIERAAVIDGSLDARPDDDGWTVLLVAPRSSTETA